MRTDSPASQSPVARTLLAEYLGSLLLASIVIGSGIAAQSLSPHDVGLELLENAAVTATGLYVLILMFGPVSGAHFNPVVSYVDAAFGGISWKRATAYLPVQVAGCVSGAVVANVMFSRAAVTLSTHHRATSAHLLSEVLATSGLLLVIFALARSGRSAAAPSAVGAYIGAAYFFTSSTSFANPAITVGRMFSRSFAGIAPQSVPGFVAAEVVGALVGFVLIRVLYPDVSPDDAAHVVVPRVEDEGRMRVTDPKRPAILFLCVHNAGRSQMAAAFARAVGGHDVVVYSAGSSPSESLNPAVVAAMGERGIDLRSETPKRLTDEMGRAADVIVTMGCGDACPVYPGTRYVDWDLADPAGQPLDAVRLIRDDIEGRVRELLQELVDGPR